jgi:microcystin-dependent protein
MGIKSKGASLPAGAIAPYAGGTIPAGWLVCAGQAISRTQYAALFLAIGTAFGVGDGASTFNVPDMRGRAVFGKDDMGGTAANRLNTASGGVDGATLGAVGGGQSVTLTSAQMPSHTHQEVRDGTWINYTAGSNGPGFTGNLGNNVNTPATPPQTGGTGSSGAHANVPPALVANYIIKT